MENLTSQLKEFSKKHYLDYKLFQIKKIKTNFISKKIITYGKNEYFFEINKNEKKKLFSIF